MNAYFELFEPLFVETDHPPPVASDGKASNEKDDDAGYCSPVHNAFSTTGRR
jgi:hypothetical protein